MNKKAIYLAILFGLIFSFLIPISFAYQYKSDDILAGTDVSILNTLNNILMYPVNLPGFKPLGIPGTGNQGVPLWILVTVFALIYSVLFYGVDNVGLFKDPKMRGAKITFTISLSLLFIFGTTLIPRFWQVLTATVGLAILLLLVFVGWGSWVVFKKIQANHETLEAEAEKQIAEARKVKADANKLSLEAKKDNKLVEAEEHSLEEIEGDFKDLVKGIDLGKRDLVKVKKVIVHLQMVSNSDPDKVHEYVKRLDKVLARLIDDLSKKFNKSGQKVDEFKRLYKSFQAEVNSFNTALSSCASTKKKVPRIIEKYSVNLNSTIIRTFENIYARIFPGNRNIFNALSGEISQLIADTQNNVEAGKFQGAISNLSRVEMLFDQSKKIIKDAEDNVKNLSSELLTLRSYLAILKKKGC